MNVQTYIGPSKKCTGLFTYIYICQVPIFFHHKPIPPMKGGDANQRSPMNGDVHFRLKTIRNPFERASEMYSFTALLLVRACINVEIESVPWIYLLTDSVDRSCFGY